MNNDNEPLVTSKYVCVYSIALWPNGLSIILLSMDTIVLRIIYVLGRVICVIHKFE